MSRSPCFVGVDLGGTKVACGLVTRSGRIEERRQEPTDRLEGPRGLVKWIAQATSAWSGSGWALGGIGIGVPGWAEADTGVVRALTNIPHFQDVPLASRVRDATGLDTCIDNDANVMVLAETLVGAAKGRNHVVGITLGTGVGGGLVLDGRIYRGSRSAGGEIGHVSINARGPKCTCGARGCIERYLGRDHLVAEARRRIRHARGSAAAVALTRLVAENDGRLTPKLMSQAAAAANPLAQEFWHYIGDRFGAFLVSLSNLLNPECFVLGGGVAKGRRHFLPAARQRLEREAMNGLGSQTPILAAKLGTDAGIVGAALLAARAQEH